MKSSFSLAKVWFAFSLAALVFVYGVGVGKWEWFPHSFLDRAIEQARAAKKTYLESIPSTKLEPKVYDRQGIRVPRPTKMQSGPTLITSAWKTSDEWSSEIRLIDEKGEIIHKWKIEREKLIPERIRGVPWNLRQANIHGNYLFPDGDMLVNTEHISLARIDACGKVQWVLGEGNHHSIDRAGDGSFWVPGVSKSPRAGSERYPDGYPGLRGKKVWIDRIIRVSEEGDLLRDINVLDVMYENNLERYIYKKYNDIDNVSTDITHINDIEVLNKSKASYYPILDAGDLMISARNIDLVFVFDPSTMKVKWHSHNSFVRQHDPDFLADGWVGVFDNNRDFTKRGVMGGGSRIVYLHPPSDSVNVKFPTKYSEPFYTPIRGKWQLLENGNMLLAESNAGRVVEVDPDGRTVWEWIHPPEGSKVPPVTKATRVNLSREEVASWSCSSVDSVSTSGQKSSPQNQQTAP